MTRQTISDMYWIHPRTVLYGLIAFMIVILAKAIYTPLTNDLLETQERAIQQSRLYASQIVDGEVGKLIYRSDQTVIKKLRNTPPPSFRNIPTSQVHETRLLPSNHWLRAPVSAEFNPPESRMQIIKLERHESYFVITFAALKEPYYSDYIESDGRPLLVTVAVRYIEEPRENLFVQWLARFANINWFPRFIREAASGDWYLIDYRYSFNLREYYDWIRANESRLYAESEQKNKESFSKLLSPTWREEINKQASVKTISLHL